MTISHRRDWLAPNALLLSLLMTGCGGGGSNSNSSAPTGVDPPVPPPPAVRYNVGGTVTGLFGSGLTLQNNDGDDIVLNADGAFSFPTTIAASSSYSVAVKAQPGKPAQSCLVKNGAGSVTNADVTNVAVTCGSNITDDYDAYVAAAGLGLIERLPQLAEFVGGRLAFLDSHRAAQVQEICPFLYSTPPAGTADYTYVDLDHDNALSAGDTVQVTFTDCFDKSLASYLNTTIKLTLLAPPQPANYSSGYAAVVELNSFTTLRRVLTGTVEIEYTDADEKRLLTGRVGSSGLTWSTTAGYFPVNENVEFFDGSASKTLDYVTPEYRVEGAATFHSSTANGVFRMSTPQPLANQFDVYPAAGAVEFRGGVSKLRYAATPGNDISQATVTLATGNVTAPPSKAFWGTFNYGFSWWESRWDWATTNGSIVPEETRFMNFHYAIPLLDPVNLILSDNLPVAGNVTLFFTQPVDTARTSFYFEGDYFSPGTPIPADMQANGAIVHLTARQELEHGKTYVLRATGDQMFSTQLDFGPSFNRLRFKTAP